MTQRHLSVRSVGVYLRDAWYCSYRCAAAAVQSKLSELLVPQDRARHSHLRMPLELVLVSRGWLTKSQLQTAKESQRRTGLDMGDTLISLGFVDENRVTAVRSTLWNCPTFSPTARASSPTIAIPSTLMRLHSVVPVHNVPTADNVLVGFRHRIDYGLLYAIEQVTECRTTPCFLTPTEHDRQMEAKLQTSEEILMDEAMTAEEMTKVICQNGTRLDANVIVAVRCGERIWVRLKGGEATADLLLYAA